MSYIIRERDVDRNNSSYAAISIVLNENHDMSKY